jgi:hypothetical protein
MRLAQMADFADRAAANHLTLWCNIGSNRLQADRLAGRD